MVQTCFICKWRASREPKRSFHKFPSEKSVRNKWLSILGKRDLKVGKRLSVCSIHFEDSCFRYGTVYGNKILKMNSIPTLYLMNDLEGNVEIVEPISNETNNFSEEIDCNSTKMDHTYILSSDADIENVVHNSEETKFLSLQWAPNVFRVSCTVEPDTSAELEAPASNKVCRICLAFDVKMYHIADYKLRQYLQQLTGIVINPEDMLPKMLCWECVGRLTSANRLRDKALKTQRLLSSKLSTKAYVSMRDVKSINRIRNGLQSTLAVKYFESDDSDLTVHIVEDVKVEYDEVYSDDNLPVLLQVKSEEPQATADEPAKRNTKERATYKRLDPSATARRKLDAPTSAARRQRSASVSAQLRAPPASKKGRLREKRYTAEKTGRAALGGLDETMFTVTSLSQAEQIAEVQRRRDSHAYLTARYKCAVCYKVFHTQAHHAEHSVQHSEQTGAFECPVCKIRLKSLRALRKHAGGRHTKTYTCNKCHFSTKDRSVAKRHELFHTGVVYQCPHCPKQFNKQTTYLGHIRLKHVSQFVCELCGYAFINQRGIEVHKFKKHKLDKDVELVGPYCEECDVRFVSEEAYGRHLRLSSRHIYDGDPNRITNDPQTAERKAGGQYYARPRVRGKAAEPVCCEQCGECCEDFRAYAQHFLRAHPGSNRTQYSARTPFMCDKCGKFFQSKQQLMGHMWVHTGEKLFKCDLCDKTFSNVPGLQLHKKSHAGTQPTFECPVCLKSFTFYSNRKRHMLIHTGLKPYKCETCGKCFMTLAERRSHVDHVHLKVPWPKRTRLPRPPATGAARAGQALRMMQQEAVPAAVNSIEIT